jgi:hypothetical protein
MEGGPLLFSGGIFKNSDEINMPPLTAVTACLLSAEDGIFKEEEVAIFGSKGNIHECLKIICIPAAASGDGPNKKEME